VLLSLLLLLGSSLSHEQDGLLLSSSLSSLLVAV
jgi:hypothetical protein